MRSTNVLLICALALAGCATNPKPATTMSPPMTPKVAPPRYGCPPGYGFLSNERGTACWKGGGHGPPWTIDEIPPPDCKPYRCTQSGYLLWNCPEISEESATAPAQRGVGVCKPRKVALQGPPGEVLSLSLSEGPSQRSYYYYRRGQDGVQYVCPFKGRKRCEEEGVPKDQECADHSQCLEVCLDAEGRVIW